MKTAVIFIGLQASGKTTFYHKYFEPYVHINLDTLRSRQKENELLTECIAKELSFVVDNTDPTRADRERYIVPAKAGGYHIKGYYFSSSVDECRRRNEKREGKDRVPDVALYSTIKKLERPSYDEGFDELFYVRIDPNDGEHIILPWDKK